MTVPEAPPIRPQRHFRPGPNGFYAWDVSRLIALSQSLPVFQLPLAEIAELDELWWYQTPGDAPTPRSLAGHFLLLREVDLSFPVLLSSNGRLMDGMHRVLKALTEGQTHVSARKFEVDPLPDLENYWPEY